MTINLPTSSRKQSLKVDGTYRFITSQGFKWLRSDANIFSRIRIGFFYSVGAQKCVLIRVCVSQRQQGELIKVKSRVQTTNSELHEGEPLLEYSKNGQIPITIASNVFFEIIKQMFVNSKPVYLAGKHAIGVPTSFL